MHPQENWTEVHNGKRYTIRTATLLAANAENNTGATFLYRTRGGAYFRADMTIWEGQHDKLVPMGREEAMALYEALPEHLVDYEKAFDAVVEEATSGRPTYYGQAMTQTAVWLPDNMIAWLKSQPGGMGETMRSLVKQAMEV